jgi:hypothetical protein
LETDSLTDMTLPSREYSYEWDEYGFALDEMRFINLETGEIMVDLFPDRDSTIFDAEMSSDGQYIAIAAYLYNLPNARNFPYYSADVYDREGNLVSIGSGDGLDAIWEIHISPDCRYFAHNIEGGNIYIGHIPNSSHYTDEPVERNIDTEIDNGAFTFTADSRDIVAINQDGLWAYDIEARTRTLLYEGEFYPFKIYQNRFAIAADTEAVFLYGVLPED